MGAEAAYVFRHALLREAAYQLMLPGDRAQRHEWAFDCLERHCGGRPPTSPIAADGSRLHHPHPTDPFAEDIVEHLEAALSYRHPAVEPDSLHLARMLYLRRAAASAEKKFEPALAERRWRRLAALSQGSGKADALQLAGLACFHSGKTAEPIHLLEEALRLFRDSGDVRMTGVACGNLASLYLEAGRIPDAERTYGTAITLHREAGNAWAEGLALGNLAKLLSETGRLDESERLYVRARETQATTGRGADSGVLAGLAIVHAVTGRPQSAEELFRQAVEAARASRERRSEGIYLGNLASLFANAGRDAEAEQHFDAAMAVHREVGNVRSLGVAMGNLGELLLSTGRLERAQECLERALAIHGDVGNRRFEGVHLCDASRLHLACGRVEEARRCWTRGSTLLREIGDVRTLNSKARAIAEACEERGVVPFEGVLKAN
jgi:tetratricopeptide (TPR) repeat protein